MASSSCIFSSQLCFSHKIDLLRLLGNTSRNNVVSQIRCTSALQSKNTVEQVVDTDVKQCIGFNFQVGSRTIIRTNLGKNIPSRKSSAVHASWLSSSEIASGAFTLGTAAVLPTYTFMVVAPKAEFTKKVVGSSAPFVVLGVLYAYLLYLSWTPDTIHLMFASKYWLPELEGMAKMFSSDMTLASAWIHLLAVDLFAARQVYHEGLQKNIETRHSVTLCLLFCPIGIIAHFITKTLDKKLRSID